MNTPIEDDKNLAKNLAKLSNFTGTNKNCQASISSQLSLFCKSLENLRSYLESFSSEPFNISRNLEAPELLSIQKSFTDNINYLPISSLKITNFDYSKIFKEIWINQKHLQEKLNIVYNFKKNINTWHKLIDSNQISSNQYQSESLTALITWDNSATKIFNHLIDSKLFQSKPILAERLLEPLTVYTDFSTKTIAELKINKSTKNFKALRASLHLVETQLLSATDILSKITEIPEDNESVSSSRSLLLPDSQQEELISLVETGDEDEQALIGSSFTAKLSSDTRDVLELIIQCNEIAKLSAQTEIFKPTTKLLEAFAHLPWLSANNKSTVAIVVDCLYFIFYEGAGKDKLRYLNSHGGVLNDNDCDFIWCIKHLRNKWLRHDPDHGKQSAIDKSWRELSAKLNWLGINYPTEEQDFRNLHHRLIQEAKIFLDKIIEKLRN